jgi:hypothetical protein
LIEPPSSPRRTGIEPWALPVEPNRLGDRLVEAVLHEAAAVGDGRLGVIVPVSRTDELGQAVADGAGSSC